MVVVYVCPRCERIYKQRKYCIHHDPPIKCTTIELGHSHPPQSSYSIERCSACNGTGVGLYGNRCPGCRGTGEVKVPNPPRRCSACNGTGINAYGSPHQACHGTGWAGGRPL